MEPISNPPLVSVLMTLYNREKYIKEAIESVLDSSYLNFELIIVDDGSTDQSLEIARRFELKDKRVKVYRNESNLGDYPNRNKAASYAMGKYLKYVDADDLIYPHGLEILVNIMEKFPNAGYGLCSIPPDKFRMYPIQLSQEEAYAYNYFTEGIFNRAPLSSIIRRDIFETVGGFSGKRMVGDFEMWHLLSLHYPVVLMPQGIIWYRSHDSQEMNEYSKFINEYKMLSFKFLQDPECPLDEPMKKIALQKVKYGDNNTVASRIKNLIKKGIKSH